VSCGGERVPTAARPNLVSSSQLPCLRSCVSIKAEHEWIRELPGSELAGIWIHFGQTQTLMSLTRGQTQNHRSSTCALTGTHE
jgi:hypothetical protein